MARYLTKSAFKAARSCPSKLYFYNYGYPNTFDEDEYLQLLAEGGHVIGKLAQVLYPDGIEITGPLDEAVGATARELKKRDVTLFEAAVTSGGMLARVDILEKVENVLKIIEVKSKSFNSAEFADRGPAYFRKKTNGWAEHIEDVAFQKLAASRAFPELKIETYLFLPDRNKRNSIDGLFGWFTVENDEAGSGYKPPVVTFTGDAQAIAKNNFMTLVDIGELVDEVAHEIEGAVPRYLESITRNERIIGPPAVKCAKCEYKKTDSAHPHSGFEVCWKEAASTRPHILELGRLGNFNMHGEIDALIASGKSSLYDVPAELVEGHYHNRPYYQVSRQQEMLSLEFAAEVLAGLEYPLHFIDFETTQSALPFYNTMRPYDRVLFQWSCHTMRCEGAPLEHYEWLHDREADPNVEFGKTLARCLGKTGTLMTWSAYENTQLASLYRYLSENNIDEGELSEWLLETAKVDGQGGDRILDLNKVAEDYYYHPLMGARTSIKVTLPAVLSAAAAAVSAGAAGAAASAGPAGAPGSSGAYSRIRDLLRAEGLYALDESGNIANPYSLLPAIELPDGAEEAERTERVNEGTGAMIAYQRMAYGGLSEKDRDIYRKALLKYCGLDTLAMVLIWQYWVSKSRSAVHHHA